MADVRIMPNVSGYLWQNNNIKQCVSVATIKKIPARYMRNPWKRWTAFPNALLKNSRLTATWKTQRQDPAATWQIPLSSGSKVLETTTWHSPKSPASRLLWGDANAFLVISHCKMHGFHCSWHHSFLHCVNMYLQKGLRNVRAERRGVWRWNARVRGELKRFGEFLGVLACTSASSCSVPVHTAPGGCKHTHTHKQRGQRD